MAQSFISVPADGKRTLSDHPHGADTPSLTLRQPGYDYVYVRNHLVAFPQDMSGTCHDCGYARPYACTRSAYVLMCRPTCLSVSDTPSCVLRDCPHWVAKGHEDPDIGYGAFASPIEDQDEVEDETESTEPIRCSLDRWL